MFRPVLETMLETRWLLRWRSLLIRKVLKKFSAQLADQPLEHGFPAQPATWKNWYRFSPLLAYFGGKTMGKISRKLALPRAAGCQATLGTREQLWGDEQVRELLRPASMKLSAWVDSAALQNFLERSERQDFPFGDQWARLVSLECSLRVACQVRHGLTA